MQLNSYLCTCMRNISPCKGEFVWNAHIHTSHVEGDRFLNSQHAWACLVMVATATYFLKFPDSLKWQLYTFPDQMNWQFLLIMASNFPLQRSSPPIYNNEFIHSVKWRIHWPYRKPYICLLFNFLKQYSVHRTCLTSVSICMYQRIFNMRKQWK